MYTVYQGADKSLARPGRKQSSEACLGRARFQQHRDASCHQFFFLQGKAPKEIHAFMIERLACFRAGRAKDLSAPLFSIMDSISCVLKFCCASAFTYTAWVGVVWGRPSMTSDDFGSILTSNPSCHILSKVCPLSKMTSQTYDPPQATGKWIAYGK